MLTADQMLVLGHPAVCLLFSLVFASLWFYGHRRNHLLLYAAAFALHGLWAIASVLLFDYGQPEAAPWVDLAGSAASLASVLLLTRGLLERCGLRPRHLWGAGAALACFALLTALQTLGADMQCRTYALGAGLGVIVFLTWVRLWPLRYRGPADRMLHWIVLVSALAFVPSTCWLASMNVLPQDMTQLSTQWLLWQLMLLLVSVIVGMTLQAVALVDIIVPLRHERNTDPLTNLLNRRSFDEMHGSSLIQQMPSPSCLVLVDLDNFKHINDTYGHAAGDEVLTEAGQVIRATHRQADRAWRLGGDEFAILLAGTTLANAHMVAERMLDRLRQKVFRAPLGTFGMTASLGIAQARPGETLHELFLRADVQLYAAKSQGRNRVVSDQPAAAARPSSTSVKSTLD